MPDLHDESDFVDTEFASARGNEYRTPVNAPARIPLAREELEAQTQATQQRLEELKRVQTRLEEERGVLEEARRRRTEYHTGREETVQNLTRGVGLLEEVEIEARQKAEEATRALADLRHHLDKVQALDDKVWTRENYATELTRALTTIENARLEWNVARRQWPLLNPETRPDAVEEGSSAGSIRGGVDTMSFMQLCKVGLALTWPITLVVLLAAGAVVVAIFARFQ